MEDGVGMWGKSWERRATKEGRMQERKKEGEGKDIKDGTWRDIGEGVWTHRWAVTPLRTSKDHSARLTRAGRGCRDRVPRANKGAFLCWRGRGWPLLSQGCLSPPPFDPHDG